VATGGFSTRNASLAGFGPYTQWVCVAFMFMAGVNFTLHFQLLRGKGRLFWADEEFRLYAQITAAAVLPFFLYLSASGLAFEPALRTAAFQATSILTTTGFATADYLSWAPLPQALILILMVLGGSAGSTAGGIKHLRILVLGKLIRRETLRVAHPGVVHPIKINRLTMPAGVIDGCVAFVALFFLIWALSTLLLAACGVDLATSASAALTCLSNVGPGFGSVGPAANFQHLPDPAKWILALDMLMGRLELFTLFALGFPEFWRR
jgi:trk system potassium uptake protein TrkH